MERVSLFDHAGRLVGEIDASKVSEMVRKEEINGEHSLTITTTEELEPGWRVLVQDARGVWREFVVFGTDETHDSNGSPTRTYYCTWSLQAEMMGIRVSAMPGTQTPVTAGTALAVIADSTPRWSVGTVTNTNVGGASMYDMDGWSALEVLIEEWGGEIGMTIDVSATKVTSRRIDLYDEQGDQDAKRRFDFGADLRSVRRKLADSPLYCRITPRGKGEETDSGGYGRKITIESVNDGKDYLENPTMVELARLPDGNGGWQYPTIEVENSDCETPAELLAWAQGVLEEYTTPHVSYDVDVLQLGREGIDMQGVSLGDAVHIVDRKFGDGIRVSGRVVSMTVNMLDESDTQLTIGEIQQGFAESLYKLDSKVDAVTETVEYMNGGTLSTAGYLDRLLDRLNAEINATGGYVYITQGQGFRTYDKAVTNPLVGSEADAVTEIKGGTIRIANSRTAQGDWDWKSVFTAGHIAAELVTAANLVTGYIQSANGATYINLDTGEVRLSTTSERDSSLNRIRADLTSGGISYYFNNTLVARTSTYYDVTSSGDIIGFCIDAAPGSSETCDLSMSKSSGINYTHRNSGGLIGSFVMDDEWLLLHSYVTDGTNSANNHIVGTPSGFEFRSGGLAMVVRAGDLESRATTPGNGTIYLGMRPTSGSYTYVGSGVVKMKTLYIDSEILVNEGSSVSAGRTGGFYARDGSMISVRNGIIVRIGKS